MTKRTPANSLSKRFLLAAVLAGAIGSSHAAVNPQPLPVWRLAVEVEIGTDSFSGDPRYEVGEILDARIMQDGAIWLLDGQFANGVLSNPQIRIFDSRGRFVRRVGSAGNGPNEYRAPYALAQLRDGRVAVRDDAFPDRIHLYRADGRPDTTWILRPRTRWLPGAGSALQVDSLGTVWLAMRGGRPSNPSDVSFMRMRPDGSIVDQVALPDLPEILTREVSLTRTLPGGGTSTVGLAIPLQPSAIWALGPKGSFAIARTDEYRIKLTAVVNNQFRPLTSVVRAVKSIPVDADERAALRRGMEAEARRLGITGMKALPDIPKRKPTLVSVSFGDDGALLVFLSAASTRSGEVWVDHFSLDLYDPNQRYRGQVPLPDGVRFLHLRNDQLLAVWQDSTGAQVLRRYRITDR